MNTDTIVMKLVTPVTHTRTGGENSRLKNGCCHVFRDIWVLGVLREARAKLTRTHQFRLS